jgi:tripartite-type tricarboxylate transporter receptor subunit TctC
VSRFFRWAAPCSKEAEAKPTGAGGMTGAVRVAKAAPDGYQFVIAGPGFMLSTGLSTKPALQRRD